MAYGAWDEWDEMASLSNFDQQKCAFETGFRIRFPHHKILDLGKSR